MKVREIIKDTYLIAFPNQYELSSTFFRLQEYYESPSKELKGKYFSLELAIDTYARMELAEKEKNVFSYFEDWNGFNVPGNVVNKFFLTFGTKLDLLVKERMLLDEIIEKIKSKPNKDHYYLIGVVEGDEETIKHEIAHAMYYLNPDYKEKMLKLIKVPNIMTDEGKKYLLSVGYCEEVLDDEIQAYFATGLRRKMIPKKSLDRKFLAKFKDTFTTYYTKELKSNDQTSKTQEK